MKTTTKAAIVFLILISITAAGFFAFSGKAAGVAKAGELPSFALSNDATREAYTAAAEEQDKFSYIACYCGCGMHEMMHRGKVVPKMNSLKECFIKADGTWEDHAAMDCPKCVTTANEVDTMLKQGKPLKEIREYIDNKYGDPAHPELGTPTPLPPI